MNDSTLDARPRRVVYTRATKLGPKDVYVGRPSRWGNPFSLEDFSREDALTRYEIWLWTELGANADFLSPLKGKNLACWCKLTEKCHADILLRYIYGKRKGI